MGDQTLDPIEHAYAAGALPRLHADPFDRMLVAQTLSEDLTIVTRDARIARYDVPTIRA
jgi:PIN domain nuclease of toxin-antitoxin system